MMLSLCPGTDSPHLFSARWCAGSFDAGETQPSNATWEKVNSYTEINVERQLRWEEEAARRKIPQILAGLAGHPVRAGIRAAISGSSHDGGTRQERTADAHQQGRRSVSANLGYNGVCR